MDSETEKSLEENKGNIGMPWETTRYIYLAVFFLKVEILLKTFTVIPPTQATIISTLDSWNSCLLNFPVLTFVPLQFTLRLAAEVIS